MNMRGPEVFHNRVFLCYHPLSFDINGFATNAQPPTFTEIREGFFQAQ